MTEIYQQGGLKQKHNPTICYLQETDFKHNIGNLKVKGWKKMSRKH